MLIYFFCINVSLLFRKFFLSCFSNVHSIHFHFYIFCLSFGNFIFLCINFLLFSLLSSIFVLGNSISIHVKNVFIFILFCKFFPSCSSIVRSIHFYVFCCHLEILFFFVQIFPLCSLLNSIFVVGYFIRKFHILFMLKMFFIFYYVNFFFYF